MNNYQKGCNNMNRPISRQSRYGYTANQPAAEKSDGCRQVPVSKPLSKHQLMNYINEVSFAVNDITLYLDTHPQDQEALQYCRKHMAMREKALKEYAKHYGPLTIDTANESSVDSWLWVTQPWPCVNGS